MVRASVAAAAVLFVACSGSGGNASSSTTRLAEPVRLTVARACMTAEVWGVSPDGTIGLGVVTKSSQPSSDQPSVIQFDASSDEVDFIAYKGKDLINQLCGGTGQPTADRITIVRGSGTLALDPLGPLPMGSRLTTTEVLLADGTVIAPLDIEGNCIGCFPT